MSDLTGSQLNDYHLLRRLGRGAMAEVYLAEQQSLARQVALKVLSPELSSQPEYVDRFHHEARSAAALVHANIVQVYEVGQANGSHFIAQEYVPGQNLGESMRRHGPVEPGRVLDILRQVASALSKAHEQSIVHRDVKPENIMLARSGEVKVADFGLARVISGEGVDRTQAGVTMGTPLYMSPEQVEGRPVDSRSDIYSLGVTAFHMLAGEPPFKGDTPIAMAVQHLHTAPPSLVELVPSAPVGLIAIIERMLAKKPEERFENPIELLKALRQLAKQAAEEGWGDGPENWAQGDFATLSSSEIEATNQLSELLRSARRNALPPPDQRWKLALFAGALVLGLLIAYQFRGPFILADSEPKVLKFETPLEQLFHAKTMADSPEGWRAVWDDRFGEIDLYTRHLAMQGLVRYYFRVGDHSSALPALRELAALPESQRSLRTFGLVGLAVAHAELQHKQQAQEAIQLLSTTDLGDLGRTDAALLERYRQLAL